MKMTHEFSSMIQVSQTRIDGLIRMVSSTLENVADPFNNMTSGWVIQSKFINELDLKTKEISHQLGLLQNHGNNFQIALKTLITGNIPSSFLPLELVQESLDQITELLKQMNTKFRLVHTNAQLIYHESHFTYWRYKDDIVVSVHFKLTDFSENFDVYQ